MKRGWHTREKLAAAKILKAEMAQMKLLCAQILLDVAKAVLATMHQKPKVTVTRTELTAA